MWGLEDGACLCVYYTELRGRGCGGWNMVRVYAYIIRNSMVEGVGVGRWYVFMRILYGTPW